MPLTLGTEIIQDGGFEYSTGVVQDDGTYQGLNKWTAVTNDAFLTYHIGETADAWQGTQGLRFIKKSATVYCYIVNESNANILTGTKFGTYLLSGYTKGDVSGSYRYFIDNGAYSSPWIGFGLTGDSYQRFDSVIYVGSGAQNT